MKCTLCAVESRTCWAQNGKGIRQVSVRGEQRRGLVRDLPAQPPPGVAEPIDWLLLTMVAVHTPADAMERIDWYICRWIVEGWRGRPGQPGPLNRSRLGRHPAGGLPARRCFDRAHPLVGGRQCCAGPPCPPAGTLQPSRPRRPGDRPLRPDSV